MSEPALPSHLRPFTDEKYHTDELPPTPQRSFRIPASGWVEAPHEVLTIGDELGEPVEYKRRIGKFLLWRAGPPIGEAWYVAVDAGDLTRIYRFRLSGKQGVGAGPDGVEYERFRSWKESLRDD